MLKPVYTFEKNPETAQCGQKKHQCQHMPDLMKKKFCFQYNCYDQHDGSQPYKRNHQYIPDLFALHNNNV